ncbi:DUF5906 domain-containing protein [Aureimonas ureilytica]|uniref:DUF5906 domain-containing protein n=1 Tax=Aureimonas ureilytica TaxID=401562 RepID=UPI0007344D84|nr:DUF5906 domain-containing protein [Aureimonas ureilytica]
MLKDIGHLVSAGFAIHRLHPKSKRPIGDDWSTKPVLTLDKLKASYRAGENVGLRLGQWSRVGGGYLHVLDLDIRDPKRVEEARARLSSMFPEWKNLPTVISGSGGASRHFYLITDKPFPSKKLAHSADKINGADGKAHWAWEIELFGTGKQVAIPPSIHPDTGKPYRWESPFDFSMLDLGIGPFIAAPRIEKLIGEDDRPADAGDERSAPLGLSENEIRATLAGIPAATYCDDRDGWLTVGMALHHEFGGSDKGFELWCEFSKRSDKFDKRDQKRVWRSFKGKNKPVRMATLVTAAREARLEAEFENLDDNEFDDLGEEESDQPSGMFDELLGGEPEKRKISKREQKLNKANVEHALGHVPPKVARINRKHAVAFINGKTVIITENRDSTVSYGTVGDLHNFYENDRVNTEKATEPVTKAWLRHKARREYPNGVVFSPGEDVEGAYNHWRGFAVEPDESGSCELILAHIRTVLCNGNEESYSYFIGWLAHMIQRPADKPGVAVVLRGLKGTGKDTLGDYIGSLFPNHHVKIANQDQLVGRFNQHQEKALLLHVEEGFWAGNKQAEGTLKHLITSEKVFIEPKGLNGFHVRSVLRLFISSNEKWVVPATEDERRYFVSDASDKYSVRKATPQQRKRYFDAIRDEMNGTGRAALLHFLMNYDLSKFDIRDVPNTSALAVQKTEGLKNVKLWWFNILQSGEPDFEVLDGDRGWFHEPIAVTKSELRDAYGRWMRTRRYEGNEVSAEALGKELVELCPTLLMPRPRIAGRRVTTYRFPTLPDCRSQFEGWIGSTLEWEDIADDSMEETTNYDDLADQLN